MTTILLEQAFSLDKPVSIEIKKQLGGRIALTVNGEVFNFFNDEDCYLHSDGQHVGVVVTKEKGDESWIKTKLKSILRKDCDSERYTEQTLRDSQSGK